MPDQRIILASKSPRRKYLLEQINLKFDVIASTVLEYTEDELTPAEFAEKMALSKASDVARSVNNALIIGADTIVVHDDEILGKPVDDEDAKRLLKRLSGHTHNVYTGVALLKTDNNGEPERSITFYSKTNVVFAKLDDKEIEEYVNSGSPMDKAGAYGIQDDWGSLFVKRIDGDYYNVVGFPLQKFYTMMKSFAPEALPHAI